MSILLQLVIFHYNTSSMRSCHQIVHTSLTKRNHSSTSLEIREKRVDVKSMHLNLSTQECNIKQKKIGSDVQLG